MKITIWDYEDSPPDYKDGKLILWQSFSFNEAPNAISIPDFIEKNDLELKSRYLSWVYEFGETNILGKRLIEFLEVREELSFWWMTQITEMCSFSKSPQINDVIRLMALEILLKKMDSNKIELFSQNKNLAESIEVLAKNIGISFEWHSIKKQVRPIKWTYKIYNSLPHIAQGYIWLINYFIKNWHLRGVGLDHWNRSKAEIIFISYLFNLAPNSIKKRSFNSQYWTRLSSSLSDRGISTNWLHIYIKNDLLPSSKDAASAISAFNESENSNQTHVTLSGFLTIKVLKQTLTDWYSIRKQSRIIEKAVAEKTHIKKYWPQIRNDWNTSTYGKEAITNLLMLNLFESAFDGSTEGAKCVYLQENQGWEFGMIQAWRSRKKGELIGFPHSTVRFWDLRYYFDPNTYNKKQNFNVPLPHKVACSGMAARNAFEKSGYPAENLIDVEALRYLHLSKLGSTRKNEKKEKKTLLVLGDYVKSSTHKQLVFLQQAISMIDNEIEIKFKAHPACPIDPMIYKGLQMHVENNPIADLINDADIVYSGANTSAVVDAYFSGIPVIILLDGTDLNLTPLNGFDDVLFVTSPEKMASILKSNLNNGLLGSKVDDYFYLDPGLPRWLKILQED